MLVVLRMTLQAIRPVNARDFTLMRETVGWALMREMIGWAEIMKIWRRCLRAGASVGRTPQPWHGITYYTSC